MPLPAPVTLHTSSNSRNQFARGERLAKDTGNVVQVGPAGLVPSYNNDGNTAGLRTGVEFLLHISPAYARQVQV